MDRKTWDAWRVARGVKKRALESKLLRDNEALVVYCVRSFTSKSQCYTDNMRDDLMQAARIGILRALTDWDPKKGAFGTIAYFWIWHELQLVVRHATSISIPRSAFLPKAKQDEMAKYAAIHGCPPEPGEVGLTDGAVERARHAMPNFVALSEADDVPDQGEGPEDLIDRKRDAESLREFVSGLSKKQRSGFWKGELPGLMRAAKAFVEKRRGRQRVRDSEKGTEGDEGESGPGPVH